MSTKQTDTHNSLQESIRDSFVKLVEEDTEQAEQALLNMDRDDDVSKGTKVWCENHLNDVQQQVEQAMSEEYQNLLSMNK